ncbi:U11/U12 small nuclear ribonucleoprotein 48 kDa protein [Spea bombifrons]|uniref:U11/U12 small nuclear ribonucleoprotein 48 kDa protein n=1 Tax=Spea bombifrons TaxID=233779 RepID=UPI00234B69B5|nr:U11/U12 small nuclear ribonucleoprotein 48 kDa protein [Spea bombifrons]
MEEAEPGSRKHLLRELQEFTEQCQGRLSRLLEELGWEDDFAPGEQDTAQCPYDSNHRMPKSSLEKHVAKCRLRKLGYSKEEEEAIYDPRYFYEKANVPSVVIDKDKQFQIIKENRDNATSGRDDGAYDKSAYSSSPVEVPQNHKHAICDLTPADRLAIYDYVLCESKKQRAITLLDQNNSDLFEDLAAKINQDDGQKGPKSHLEIMAEMRDYKRRRQSYRAKNVHITKKSYTEIIRDVIDVHMEELTSHWKDEAHDEASSTISSSSVRRKEVPRSPSLDSRHSTDSHRDSRHSGRHRERSRSPRRHRSRDKEDSKQKRDREKERHHSHKRRRHKED